MSHLFLQCPYTKRVLAKSHDFDVLSRFRSGDWIESLALGASSMPKLDWAHLLQIWYAIWQDRNAIRQGKPFLS